MRFARKALASLIFLAVTNGLGGFGLIRPVSATAHQPVKPKGLRGRGPCGMCRARGEARCCSSVVEHPLGKGEVESSILSNSTISLASNLNKLLIPMGPFPSLVVLEGGTL